MMNLCFTSCLRASNLSNITLHDVLNAKEHEEMKDAFNFSNDKYKTLLIYGTKIIVVSKEFL